MPTLRTIGFADRTVLKMIIVFTIYLVGVALLIAMVGFVLLYETRIFDSQYAAFQRMVDLRPGTYTLTFALPGFTTVRREGLELAGSRAARACARREPRKPPPPVIRIFKGFSSGAGARMIAALAAHCSR